ncbi:MAG: VOC family protein [Gemmatimonadetes bacterium]|nr:VOC family protein [Gemmatimonadota bacterium]
MAIKTRAKPSRAAKRTRRPKRRQPETLRLRDVRPGLTVNDIERSMAWYRDVLGCVVLDRWEHGGQLSGAVMKAGSALIYLGQDDWKKGRNRSKGEGFRLYCSTVQNVDKLAALIEARGGRLTQPPTDQPWGDRDFGVLDPDGFKITISMTKK